jgi:hypothetical protein
VPAGYVPNTPAPFIVVQDERWYIPEDAPLGADGKPRTDLAFMPVMLDNLIHEKRIPPIVAVLLSPGPGRAANHRVRHDLGPLPELRGNRGAAADHARLPDRLSLPIPTGARPSAKAQDRRRR